MNSDGTQVWANVSDASASASGSVSNYTTMSGIWNNSSENASGTFAGAKN